MIGIVDYNAGNITSVERALKSLGIEYVLSKNPQDLKDCSKLIFPGVGDAAYAMEQLAKTGFDGFLKDWAAQNKPLLGICLGSQIIFDWSEEGKTECLGLIKGKIKLFDSIDKDVLKAQGLKVPHMGWNSLKFKKSTPLFEGISDGAYVYFVHSYYLSAENISDVSSTTEYGVTIHASVANGNLFATQFHPEKSGDVGLQMLRNFVSLCGGDN